LTFKENNYRRYLKHFLLEKYKLKEIFFLSLMRNSSIIFAQRLK